MTPDAWIMLAIIGVVVVVLVRNWLPPTITFLGALIATLAIGINDVDAALKGFSNEAIFIIAGLFVLAKAAEKTGFISPLLKKLLVAKKSHQTVMARVLAPTTAISGFMNNTPIVAVLVPQINRWAEKHKQPLSRYLMPLSFAAILGGMLTLIGTSTNVVISGLLSQSGYGSIGFFEITKIGLPIAVLGLLFLIFFSDKFLPKRRSAQQEMLEDARQFVIDMRVTKKLHGKTVRQAKLRNLEGVFLAEVERESESITPVSSDTIVYEDDTLRFVGNVSEIVDLQRLKGVEPTEHRHVTKLDFKQSAYFEAVIGVNSPLVGKTLKEVQFRSIYQAAVMAIHRSGQRIKAKPGSVKLQAGDTLLLVSDPYFRSRWSDRRDFIMVYQLGAAQPANGKAHHPRIFAGIVAGIVALVATGLLPISAAVLLGAVLTVAFGILHTDEARRAIDFEVLIMIAAALGVAQAVSTTGLAEVVATGLTNVFSGLGVIGVLAGVILATIILTEMVTNSAAALLVFPIAISSAQAIGADPRGFAIAVAIAASASFLTPIGYQTNTMVYGPGGYRFTDYIRLGLPLTVLVVAGLLLLVPLLYP